MPFAVGFFDPFDRPGVRIHSAPSWLTSSVPFSALNQVKGKSSDGEKLYSSAFVIVTCLINIRLLSSARAPNANLNILSRSMRRFYTVAITRTQGLSIPFIMYSIFRQTGDRQTHIHISMRGEKHNFAPSCVTAFPRIVSRRRCVITDYERHRSNFFFKVARAVAFVYLS